ncbi:Uncharacterised protein [Bordetella pertussis]|nr:Uncharacterised protein [Bordetella pertussis]
MRSRSPENSALSSPPVPARISRNRLRPSSGSRGSSSNCSAASISSMRARPVLISSSAMAFMSGSDSISCAVATSASTPRNALNASTTGSSSARSRDSLRKRSISAAVSGSASKASTSMRRWANCSSRLRMDGFMGVRYQERMDTSGRPAHERPPRRRGLARAANGGNRGRETGAAPRPAAGGVRRPRCG